MTDKFRVRFFFHERYFEYADLSNPVKSFVDMKNYFLLNGIHQGWSIETTPNIVKDNTSPIGFYDS